MSKRYTFSNVLEFTCQAYARFLSSAVYLLYCKEHGIVKTLPFYVFIVNGFAWFELKEHCHTFNTYYDPCTSEFHRRVSTQQRVHFFFDTRITTEDEKHGQIEHHYTTIMTTYLRWSLCLPYCLALSAKIHVTRLTITFNNLQSKPTWGSKPCGYEMFSALCMIRSLMYVCMCFF